MIVKTPEDLMDARDQLGWSTSELGLALRLAGDRQRRGSYVRDMENGARPINGPVSLAVEALVSGWRPDDFVDPRGD